MESVFVKTYKKAKLTDENGNVVRLPRILEKRFQFTPRSKHWKARRQRAIARHRK